MAKRRKRSSAGLVLGAVAILAGIAAAAMLFLPAVAVKDSETTYTGLQIALGYSEKLPVIGAVAIFKFSFMNLLTYILAVAGVLFAVAGALGRGGKLLSFIAAAAFIASGVFFLLSPSFCIINDTVSSVITLFGGNVAENLSLAVGSIVGAVAAFVAGAAQLIKVIAK